MDNLTALNHPSADSVLLAPLYKKFESKHGKRKAETLTLFARRFFASSSHTEVARLPLSQIHDEVLHAWQFVQTRAPVPHGWLDMNSNDLREYSTRFGQYSGFVALYNATGAPSMSVPLGLSPDGLPIGMLFSAPWGQDLLLLQLARSLERIQSQSCFPMPTDLA